MTTSVYCLNCGFNVSEDSRFCESCGVKIESEKISTIDSSEDSLIGHIIETIENQKRISYKTVIELSGSTDHADRLIARLENTDHFKVVKEKKEYFLVNKHYNDKNTNISKNIDPSLVKNLETFLQMGPILLQTIPGLMGISEDESKTLIASLIQNMPNLYTILRNGNSEFLSLKE